MSSAKAFGVIVRGLWVLLFVYSLYYLAYGMMTLLAVPVKYLDLPAQYRAFKINYFLSGALLLIVSIYLLFLSHKRK